MDMLRIDCGSCVARGPACDDCMVTALLGADHGVVELCSDEVSALRAMTAEGLLPPLRLVKPVSWRLAPAPEEDRFALGEGVV